MPDSNRWDAPGATPRRGRPAAARPFAQLFIELHRLTSCGDKPLAKCLDRARRAGGLPGMPPVSESAIQRMLAAANIGSADRPGAPRAGLPGWCAVHVVPVMLGPSKRADMALMFEPFSGALFGEIKATFNGEFPGDDYGHGMEPELAAFVRRSLKRLPPALVSRITTVRLTAPVPHPGVANWYSNGVVVGDVKPVPYEQSRPMMVCETDGRTELYGALDLRALFGLTQIPQANAYLACALDAHNLTQESEKPRGLRPYVLAQPWDADGGPTFRPDFMRGKACCWPPQARLDAAVPLDLAARQLAQSSVRSEVAGAERAKNATLRERLRYGFAHPQPSEAGGDGQDEPTAEAGLV